MAKKISHTPAMQHLASLLGTGMEVKRNTNIIKCLDTVKVPTAIGTVTFYVEVYDEMFREDGTVVATFKIKGSMLILIATDGLRTDMRIGSPVGSRNVLPPLDGMWVGAKYELQDDSLMVTAGRFLQNAKGAWRPAANEAALDDLDISGHGDDDLSF